MRVLWFGRYKSHSIHSTSNAQACLLKSSTRQIRTCWPKLAVMEPPGGVAARIGAQIHCLISSKRTWSPRLSAREIRRLARCTEFEPNPLVPRPLEVDGMLVIGPCATNAELGPHRIGNEFFLAVQFDSCLCSNAGEVHSAQLDDQVAGAQAPRRRTEIIVKDSAAVGARSVGLVGVVGKLKVPIHPPAGMAYCPEHHSCLPVGHVLRIGRGERELLDDHGLPGARIAKAGLHD